MSLWALKCTCDLQVLAFLLSFSPSLGEGVDSSQSSEQIGGEAGGGDEKEKEKVEEHNDSSRVRIPMEVAEGSGKLSVYLHKREDQKASDIIRPLLRYVHTYVCVCTHTCVFVWTCVRPPLSFPHQPKPKAVPIILSEQCRQQCGASDADGQGPHQRREDPSLC